MPVLNLQNMPEGGGNPVTPGVYGAIVRDALYKDEGSKEFIEVSFELTSGERKGYTVKNWFHLTHPEARRISLEQLGLLGVGSSFNPKNAHLLVGKRCQLMTELSDDGKYTRVKRLYGAQLPDGAYDARLVSVVRGENQGRPLLRATYNVSGGEFDGVSLDETWWLHDAALGWTAGRIRRLGQTDPQFDTDNDSHIQRLVNTPVRITVDSNTSERGVVYNRIQSLSVREGASQVDESNTITLDTSSVAGTAAAVVEAFDDGLDSDHF